MRKKVESARRGPGSMRRMVVWSVGVLRGFWVSLSRRNARKGAESLVACRAVRLVKARKGSWKKCWRRPAVDETKVRKRRERVNRWGPRLQLGLERMMARTMATDPIEKMQSIQE